ncbi:hypothetical protein FXO38_09033 [Capsicum annuum]|nr:hypothetical protein FXO38_09033 [Capsicum annuum]
MILTFFSMGIMVPNAQTKLQKDISKKRAPKETPPASKTVWVILEQPSSDIYPNASKYYQDISAKHEYSFPGKVVGVRFESQDVLTTAAPAKEAIKPTNNNNDDNDIDLFKEEIEEERRQQKQERLLRNLPRRKQVKSHLFLWMLSLGIMKLTIKKKQIMLTIINELFSVDTLIEERLTIEPINEYVQSCDIVAFKKI